MTKAKRVIVLSVDSLIFEDFEVINKLPNFKSIIDRGSYVKRVKSTYPTLTYTAHATIMTGVHPDKHGIYHNEKCDVGNTSPDWFWYRDSIKVKTFTDIAKEAGFSTGAVFWPVMGSANVDCLVTEIWPPNPADELLEVLLESSTKDFIKEVYPKYHQVLDWKNQPNFDEFANACTVDMIKTRKPEVIFIHLSHLDHARHKNGLFGANVVSALKKHDEWLGNLIQATKDAGVFEDTTFIVLGDHGQLAIKNMICPNIKFREHNLITVDENNKITDWKAYSHSAACSAHIILKDPEDAETRKKVEEVLQEMKQDESLGIEAIYSKQYVAEEYKLQGNFEYILEGREGFSFANDWSGEIIRATDNKDYKYSVATHGHDPAKGPQPMFIAAGPGVKKGIVIERADLVDEGPTIAAMMGLEMPGVDGKILTGLLE